MNYYRPQRSWAKVIFSQACVCPQGGRGVCLSACWDIPPPEQTPSPRADPSGSRHPPLPQEQTPPPPRSRHPPPRKHTPAYGQRAAGTHLTRMHSCCDCDCVDDCEFLVLKKRKGSKMVSAIIFVILIYIRCLNKSQSSNGNHHSLTNRRYKSTLRNPHHRHGPFSCGNSNKRSPRDKVIPHRPPQCRL